MNFFVAFNLAYVAVALVVIAVGTLFYLALREYLLRYLLMAIFAIGSLGFFYSVNYVFNDILQPHQQVRIKIALGIESDLKGKGYNVDQSKIAIGLGWASPVRASLKGTQTKLKLRTRAGDGLHLLYRRGGVGLRRLDGTTHHVRRLHPAYRGACRAAGDTLRAGLWATAWPRSSLFHLFINVGMVLGLVPVIGIPYLLQLRGSSLWGFTFLLFIFLGIDSRRKQHTAR